MHKEVLTKEGAPIFPQLVRDFVEEGGLKLLSVQEIAATKAYTFQNDFNARLFLEQLIYLDDVEDTDMVFIGEGVDKDEVKQFFEKEIDTLHLV